MISFFAVVPGTQILQPNESDIGEPAPTQDKEWASALAMEVNSIRQN